MQIQAAAWMNSITNTCRFQLISITNFLIAAAHYPVVLFFILHPLILYPLPPAAPPPPPPSLRRQTSLNCPTLSPSRLRWKRRFKWRMKAWPRDQGTVYLHPKRLCKFRGEASACVSPPPPPPPLAEIYKEQKIRRGREGGGLIFAEAEIERRTQGKRSVISTRDFPPLSPPQKEGEKSQYFGKTRKEWASKGAFCKCGYFIYIFISGKIWPRTFWTLARLQPRGLNSPRCPPPMGTVRVF